MLVLATWAQSEAPSGDAPPHDVLTTSKPAGVLAQALAPGQVRPFGWFVGLLLLPILYQLAFKQTIRVPTSTGPELYSLIPIWPPLWYTTMWLLFAATLGAVLQSRAGRSSTGSDLLVRRTTVVAVGLIFALELATRLATHHLPGGVSLSPAIVVVVAVGLAAGVVFGARWPPHCRVIVGVLLLAGLLLRLVGLAAITPDAEFADNLPAIAAALQRLEEGASPYGVYALANHSTTMAYPPLTFLAYLPAHAAGIDIRLTNVLLSLTETIVVLLAVRTLRVPEPMRSGLVLACAINYVLPLNLGHDLQTEFQPFDCALVLGVALLVTGRARRAAALFGVALGAMPVGLYCVAPLLSFGVRRLPRWELVRLVSVATCIAVVPLIAFYVFDPSSLIQAATAEVGNQWGNVSGGLENWPYSPLWYGMGASLEIVQVGLFGGLAIIAALRVRTAVGAAQFVAVSYLLLVLSGPQSGSHVLAVVVPLVLLAEAARHGQRRVY